MILFSLSLKLKYIVIQVNKPECRDLSKCINLLHYFISICLLTGNTFLVWDKIGVLITGFFSEAKYMFYRTNIKLSGFLLFKLSG